MSHAKAFEPIMMLFWMLTQVAPRNYVLDGVQIPAHVEAILRDERARHAQDVPGHVWQLIYSEVTQQGAGQNQHDADASCMF